MADIPRDVRAAVLNRANGRCEWCGRWTQQLNLHHRLFRSRRIRHDGGNIHDGDNLVALCGSGNHTGCHGRAHGAGPDDYAAAVAAGMTIPSGGSPAATSIWSVWFGFAVWLLPNGDYVPDRPATISPATMPTLTTNAEAPGPKTGGGATIPTQEDDAR